MLADTRWRGMTKLLMATSFLSPTFIAAPALAQSIYCPNSVVTGQVGNLTFTATGANGSADYALQNGACTNGSNGSGAFSGAALASQALSGLSQSTTTETNRSATSAIDARRTEERQRSAAAAESRQRESQDRRAREQDRQQSRPVEPVRPKRAAGRPAQNVKEEPKGARVSSEPARDVKGKSNRARVSSEPGRGEVSSRRIQPAQRRRNREQIEEVSVASRRALPQIVRKGYDQEVLPAPNLYLLEGPRFGAFAQGFGDFERRNGRAETLLRYQAGPQNPVEDKPFSVLQKSSTTTVGFLGGVDLTTRNIADAGDGLITGLLTGYTSTAIDITTRTLSTNDVPPGSASTKVSLSGPSVGAFATYFNQGFSIDQTLKADFFRLDQSFTESLGFCCTVYFRNPVVTNATVSGRASTDLTQLSSIGNLNYRFYTEGGIWFEPTVGYQYTNSSYDTGAAQIGLRDGYLIRVQGGARFGYEGFVGNTRVTAILTGLAYENIVISGGFIQTGAFGSNVVALNDEGKLRGQGILTLALDHGNGFSTFLQGDVRGGDRYLGAGGRGGIRYQW